MPILRRQETTDGRGSLLVAELTTGQAVVFLCAAIMSLGAAFVTGRLVAQVDRPIGLAAQPAAQAPVSVVDPAAAPGVVAPNEASTVKESAPPAPAVATGPTQTYTIPAMEAGADTPAASAQPASAASQPASKVAAPTLVAAAPPAAPSAQAAVATAVAAAPAGTAATGPPPVVDAAPAGIQPIPAAAAPPPQVIPVPPVSQPAAPVQTSPLAAGTKQRLTDLPPLPSNHEAAAPVPVPVEKAPVVETQPVQVAAAPTQIVPVDPPAASTAPVVPAPGPAAAVPEPTPSVALPAPAEAAPPITPPVAPAPKATAEKPASAAQGGTFAVQLGSFEGAQAQVKAQNLQKRIKKDYGLNAQILTSEKEKLSRVVLTGYADKNSASVACSELRKKSGLSGAFVRAI